MDRQRKREILGAWKERRPEMGVVALRCAPAEETFLTIDPDIPQKFNRIRFQLSVGNHPNQRLQALWTQYGQEAFDFQVVKRLDYQDPKEDHQEELETLWELCLLEQPEAKRL